MYTMDHPDLTVSNFIENYIGLKGLIYDFISNHRREESLGHWDGIYPMSSTLLTGKPVYSFVKTI